MGAAESKSQLSPPETPQYLKYSHLREIEDPRSPGDVPRTPIFKLDDTARLIDPRSPTQIVPRTPLYCIPVLDYEESATDCGSDYKPVQELKSEVEKKASIDNQELGAAGKEEDANCSKLSVSLIPSAEVESSPEKAQNMTGLSEKGYLIKRSKSNRKRHRRRRKKGTCNDENVDNTQSQQNPKMTEKHQEKRLPLAPRNNYIQFGENESPSMDMMIKNTKRLSLNAVPKSLGFSKLEEISLGKENFAAVFTP